MQINTLKRVTPNMNRVIVARGGKRGKTSGRGGKGQSARAGNKRRPEWRDIIKKLPKLRGRGVSSHKPVSEKPLVVDIAIIEGVFSAGDSITPAILIEKGVIATLSGRTPKVKFLGDTEVTKSFKISGGITVSAKVAAAVAKAGGSVEATKAAEKAKPGHAGNAPKVSAAPKQVKAVKTAKAPKAVKAVKEKAAPAPKKDVK